MISTGADPIIAVAIEKALAQGDTLTAASYAAISSGTIMMPNANLAAAAIQGSNKMAAELSISNVVDTRQSDNYKAIRSMVNAQNKEGQ